MDGASDGAHLDEVERWRAGRLASLTGPEGWLTLVGLWWLNEGENTVGTDPSNAVVLPEGKGPPHVGSIREEGGLATASFHPAAGVTHEGSPVASLELRDDRVGSPTKLRLGSLTFYVIEREGRLAVRVKDRESPTRLRFAGIEHYPVDARWRLDARFEAYDPPRSVAVPTVLGRTETYLVPGALAFQVEGAGQKLEVFLEDGEKDLFVVFGDLTNRDETFGGGRYLYTLPPGAGGGVVVDFNKAYNPPCAFTPHATCPLPLPQNRLGVRIEAGEKRYGPPARHG